jgi:hypothetical protein
MSGPIIRKYGFPNFDAIFGARPLEHGVEDPEAPESKTAGDTQKTVSKEQRAADESAKAEKAPRH